MSRVVIGRRAALERAIVKVKRSTVHLVPKSP